MSYPDLGRTVLAIQIGHHLGEKASRFDIPALIEAYIKRFGFVDVGEVAPAAFTALSSEHRKKF